DSITGWAVGDFGVVIKTLDGGESWTLQNSTTENNIVDVFFINHDLGWASSINYTNPPYGTLLLKTINGGVDWVSETYLDENIFINCIFFLDTLVGWMGGSPHAIVGTTDGGINWQQAAVDTSTLAFFPVLSIKFYDDQYGYASGGLFDIAGVTWRTNNGGELWYAIDVMDAPADEVHVLHLFDSINVMGAGGDPDFGYGVGLIRTHNGGVNWDYEELIIQGNAVDIDFVNEAEVWAPLGPLRTFIYSIDTGTIWTQIPTPESSAIYDVMFPDSLHGYAVGNDGVMLRFIPKTPVGIVPATYLQNKDLLHQNFPNPFKYITTITFELKANHQLPVLIKVFDIFGILVASLSPEERITGIGNVTFIPENLPDGIYHYQLIIGDEIISTKRMMLMK
ncbi:MAG: T9SS type A sorting domain-containing protein, partial [Bacteroidota bacterium]